MPAPSFMPRARNIAAWLRPRRAVRVLALVTLAAGAIAPAQTVKGSGNHRWDIAVSGGINNPAGTIGLESDLRFTPFFSVGVAGGIGTWGPRLSPQFRVYPFGADWQNLGVFVETGLSVNLGGQAEIADGSTTTLVVRAPTPALNISMGLRRHFGERLFGIVRAGWEVAPRLAATNYTVVGGATLSPAAQAALNGLQPGGVILGASFGYSFL
jgi:hypothetical protein